MRILGFAAIALAVALAGCGEGVADSPPSGFDGYVATVQGMT